MKHVEAVIQLFNPDFNVRTIAARRRQQSKPVVQARHSIPRAALDVAQGGQGTAYGRSGHGRRF